MTDPSENKYGTHANIGVLLTQWLGWLKHVVSTESNVYELANAIDSFVSFLPTRINDAMLTCSVCKKPKYNRKMPTCDCEGNKNSTCFISFTTRMIEQSIAFEKDLIKNSAVRSDRASMMVRVRAQVKRFNQHLARSLVQYLNDVMEKEGMSWWMPTTMTLHDAKPSANSPRRTTPTLDTVKPSDK